MFKKFSYILIGLAFGSVSIAQLSYGESSTIKVESSSTQTSVTPAATKKAQPPTTTTTTSNTSATTTTQIQPRQALNEDTLKKISDTLCADGFKAYVGTNRKNVCQGKVSAPDIAYSCVWKKKGTSAYSPSKQGPCKLDFAEHSETITMTKNQFSSNPPLSYGVEAECCVRSAVGAMSSN